MLIKYNIKLNKYILLKNEIYQKEKYINIKIIYYLQNLKNYFKTN